MSELSNITFHLNFISDGTGLKQIDEPIGFDKVDFTLQQDKGRKGRDMFFAGSNEAEYTFPNAVSEYGYEFERLIDYDKIYGFESEIEFIIRDGEFDYIVGELEFQQKKSDYYTFFDFSIVVSTTQALVKRRNDVKVDLFSDEDLDGNYIEPVQTSNILIPAKPEVQISEWKESSSTSAFSRVFQALGIKYDTQQGCNSANAVIKSDIKNTLSFISPSYTLNSFGLPTDENFSFIEAINELTNLTIDITNIQAECTQNAVDFFDDEVVSGSGFVKLWVKIGTDIDNITEEYVLWQQDFEYTNGDPLSDPITVPSEFSLELESVNAGKRIYIYFENYAEAVFTDPPYETASLVEYSILTTLDTISVKINTTSTGVDTVARGVRLINGFKQISTSINPEFEYTLPRLDVDGEQYNQFLVDGNLIRGREFPFVIPFKDIVEHLNEEFNYDYEVNENSMFVGNDEDFYPSNEIAVFDAVKPDKTYNIGNNEKFLINEFTLEYKKYNQDKDDENTIDAVHTQMELLNANRKVENTKEIKIPFARDPFLIGTTQSKASSETSTSLTQDDQVFILDCVKISPLSRGGIIRPMQHNVNSNGNLQLLGTGFNWNILGFQLADIFTIENTVNAGEYTVIDITNNIVTIAPNGFIPQSIEGEVSTEVSYPLTDVDYVFRTDEGFDLIDGVASPDKYGNLKYTIKRNILNYWGRYLATSTLFKQEDIKVQYFKNNVDLTTQFDGGDIINELDNITQEDLPTPLLTNRIITTKVLCTFAEYRAYQEAVKQINETDTHIKTKGGFIRVCGNNGEVLKGYTQESSYSVSDGTMDLVLEEKYESNLLTIDVTDGIFIINEVGYDVDILPMLEYNSSNDYIQFFDANTRPLTNKTRYDFVQLNGVVYDTIIELENAINLL